MIDATDQARFLTDLRRVVDTLSAALSHVADALDRQIDDVRPEGLQCAECGRSDPGDERGWTLRLDCDDELVAFCPACDRREFGDV